jgi:predicted nucleic acid-binding protein
VRLVVDASVAVKWLVPERNSDDANQLLADQHELYAPRLMAYEAGNALWRKAQRREIEPVQAVGLVASLADVSMTWIDVDDVELSHDALRLALALRHPIYDCVYLALARRIGATLVTADARFARTVSSTEYGDTVVMLGDRSLEG